MDELSEPLQRLVSLRQHQQSGVRAPHKPLLVLLALGRFAASGSSALPWSEAEATLAALIAEYGPPSKTGPRQAAAYPFTRLRTDGVWLLDQDVPMDRLTPLVVERVVGQLTPEIEAALSRDRVTVLRVARALVEAEFPPTVAAEVLVSVGLDPDEVYGTVQAAQSRRRSAAWPAQVITAWDRQCAFCGFDGQLGNASVGLEAAHVRWFNFDGPDSLDNGLALCALHHKLFDRGAIGISNDLRIRVSSAYTARTEAGRLVYDLVDRELRPRPGTQVPAPDHLRWHQEQVYKV